MAWNNSDLELYFLDDNDIADPTALADWTAYRNGLVWKKWGKRPSSEGTVGSPANFPELDGVNDAASMPIYFLRGKYLTNTVPSGHNLTKDYIVASADSNLSNHPLYQYTWIAVQNRNTAGDVCLRFGCSAGQTPSGWNGVALNGVGDPKVDNVNYTSVRWMGVIDGSDEATLANFKTNNANFPHKVDIQQRNSGYALNGQYNWWDAMGAATASKKVYYGYNNLYSYNLTTAHYPWQIARWMQTYQVQSPRTEHCMDIPAGKTLVGIITITKDSQADQVGNTVPSVPAVSNFGWKYCEVECKYDYLVIS